MRLRSLDGWRGAGAVLVALAHLEIAGLAHLGGILDRVYVLIDFFFVLSGFVITAVYGDAIADLAAARRFAIRRIGRIWPLHLAVMGAFVAVELVKFFAVSVIDFTPTAEPFTGSRPADMIVPTVLMLHVFGLDGSLTWNFPSWSAAAEIWIYLLFAAVALATLASRTRRLVVAAAIVTASGAILVLFAEHRMNSTYDFGAVRCAYGFFTGVLLHAVWTSGRLGWLKGTAAELIVGGAATWFIFQAAGTPIEYAAPLVFAVLTLVFAADAGAISRLLSGPVFAALGRWSYSIYMVHALVLTVLMPRFVASIDGITGDDAVLGTIASVSLYLTVVIGLSVLTYRFVELPGQSLAASLSGRSPDRRPAVAASVTR